jgi:hypothetical protein
MTRMTFLEVGRPNWSMTLDARPPANVIRLIRGPDAGVRSDEV